MFLRIVAVAATTTLFTISSAFCGAVLPQTASAESSMVGCSSMTDNWIIMSADTTLTPNIDAQLEKAAQKYKDARLLRIANAPIPHADLEAARTITADESVVRDIVYGKNVNKIIQQMTLENLQKRYTAEPTSFATSGEDAGE
jgi:hypothetical protein